MSDDNNMPSVNDIFGDLAEGPTLFESEAVEESEGDISEEDVTEESEEETTEESEEESEESEEEPDESEESDDESEEPDEEEEESNPVAENLKKALHAERAKRKEATDLAQKTQESMEAVLNEGNQYKQAYEAVIASLKENDLEGVVEVPSVDTPSQEVLEARKMKQEQESNENIKKFYDFVKTEATSLAPDYNEIDLSNGEHGTALTQIITAAVVNGVEKDAAVAESMKVLNTIIANAKKEALKNRQPAVKPKPKPKARTKKSAPSSRKEMARKGDVDGFFRDLGKQLAEGN